MTENNSLEILKQSFEKILPSKDGRTKISPLEFIITFIFHYLGDSKTFSLESIRKSMKVHLGKGIKRSSFWERLSRNRLKEYLKAIVADLMKQFNSSLLLGKEILTLLNVSSILIIDSSTITLINSAKRFFSGTGSKAGIKWHACFNLLSGQMEWFKLSPSSTHDSQCFPDITQLENKLIIFDLGYFKYDLLLNISKIGGFFLSRLKSNSVVYITKNIQGFSKNVIGSSLLSVHFKGEKKPIVEAMIEKICDEGTLQCRAIGFWNQEKNKYHWYLTNLTAAAYIIYPLYRARWQIELIFKACKRSLNANQISSGNKNIIESLLLASIAAYLSTYTILSNSLPYLNQQQKQAISFQRIAKIAVSLNREFIMFLLKSSKKELNILLEKIKLFSDEIFDPNYKHRKTSVGVICDLLGAEI